MRFAVTCALFALAASAAAQMAPMPLFTLTGESTDGLQICQGRYLKDVCKIIRLLDPPYCNNHATSLPFVCFWGPLTPPSADVI